jgi:hypothetical protein
MDEDKDILYQIECINTRVTMGDGEFVAAIIKQAITDAVSVMRPRPMFVLKVYKNKKVRKTLSKFKKAKIDKEIMASEAREFISINNWFFKYCCEILGFESEWIAKKSWEIIHIEDKNSHLVRSIRNAKINISH